MLSNEISRTSAETILQEKTEKKYYVLEYCGNRFRTGLAHHVNDRTNCKEDVKEKYNTKWHVDLNIQYRSIKGMFSNPIKKDCIFDRVA